MTQKDKIRYATCWEDADLLLTAFPDLTDKKVFSIASGGENTFALLSKNPRTIVAVDMNSIQLYVVELKMAAMRVLTHKEYLEFIGVKKSQKRKLFWDKIKPTLSENSLKYFNEHVKFIEKGIIHSGKFENYFSLFRKYILPLVHSKKTVLQLFEKKSEIEQQSFYEKKWNNWRWKLLFKIFFSRTVMGYMGRRPEYLNQVTVNVGTTIYNRAAEHLQNIACQENEFLYYIMTGKFGEHLPFAWREENYELIKSNLHKIVLFKGDAKTAIKKHQYFDAYNFSNIFEYMSEYQFRIFMDSVIAIRAGEAYAAYWNLMVRRKFTDFNRHFKNFKFGERKPDKGFFYMEFVSEYYAK